MFQRDLFARSTTAAVPNIYEGDWRDVAESWPRPFVLITDPPYGIAYRSKRRDPKRVVIMGDESTVERDSVLELDGWEAAAVFGPGGHKVLQVPPWGSPRALLTYDKGKGTGMGDLSFPWAPNTESIAIYGNGWKGSRSSSVLRGHVLAYSRSTINNGRRHPHEKPLNIIGELVRKAPPGLPIVDPFLGSGTTAVACLMLGREFYGAELDPQYHATIRHRIARASASSVE